jgi:type VI protein secretion system component VasF
MLSKETKGFIYGFAASIAAGVITLYIFYNYMQKQTAETVIKEYRKRLDNPSTEQLLELSKLYNR